MEQAKNTRQYLTFNLDEIYAFPVVKVTEVLELPLITRVPGSPEFISGVINNRGSVVPVINLRTKLGLPESDLTEDARIIVLEKSLEEELIQIGVMVDKVLEVFSLADSAIDNSPELGINIQTKYICGLGKIEDAFIIILDIDEVFSMEELRIFC